MSEPLNPEGFRAYARRAAWCSPIVACMTLLMVGSLLRAAPEPRPRPSALILAAASVNAFLVAGYLMHLISEQKMI